jgi:transposase
MAPLELSADEVSQLQNLAGSRTLPHSIVQSAQIVLACAAGETNTAVAKRFCVRGSTVGKWRQRYLDLGIQGLHNELRPGRPRTYEVDKVAEVINRILQSKPTDGSTHWSARSLAAATGISKTTVHRSLQTLSVQPHRQKYFKLSTDPFFVEKVRDIVALYLNPADKAMVLCDDEKTQRPRPRSTGRPRRIQSWRSSSYADDVICHCHSRAEAERLMASLQERFVSCGLTLHPQKTQVVYSRTAAVVVSFLGFSSRFWAIASGRVWPRTGMGRSLRASCRR